MRDGLLALKFSDESVCVEGVFGGAVIELLSDAIDEQFLHLHVLNDRFLVRLLVQSFLVYRALLFLFGRFSLCPLSLHLSDNL